MIESRNFYINGQWVAPATPCDLTVIDPSTEQACAVISLGSEADTNAAVAAAKAAFATYALTSPADRLALVRRILAIYKRRSDEMAAAISLEMGAPLDMSRSDQAPSGDWHMEGFIDAFETMHLSERLGPQAP